MANCAKFGKCYMCKFDSADIYPKSTHILCWHHFLDFQYSEMWKIYNMWCQRYFGSNGAQVGNDGDLEMCHKIQRMWADGEKL
jgi:hypothetical protein